MKCIYICIPTHKALQSGVGHYHSEPTFAQGWHEDSLGLLHRSVAGIQGEIMHVKFLTSQMSLMMYIIFVIREEYSWHSAKLMNRLLWCFHSNNLCNLWGPGLLSKGMKSRHWPSSELVILKWWDFTVGSFQVAPMPSGTIRLVSAHSVCVPTTRSGLLGSGCTFKVISLVSE